MQPRRAAICAQPPSSPAPSADTAAPQPPPQLAATPQGACTTCYAQLRAARHDLRIRTPRPAPQPLRGRPDLTSADQERASTLPTRRAPGDDVGSTRHRRMRTRRNNQASRARDRHTVHVRAAGTAAPAATGVPTASRCGCGRGAAHARCVRRAWGLRWQREPAGGTRWRASVATWRHRAMQGGPQQPISPMSALRQCSSTSRRRRPPASGAAPLSPSQLKLS